MNWERTPTFQDDLCEVCGKRPKYVENGFQHPFCGRSCARQKQQSRQTACGLQRCPSTAKASLGGFCSLAHARDAVRFREVKGCTYCKTDPATKGDLCISCERKSSSGSWLKELDINGPAFNRVQENFSARWRSAENRANVAKIYEVMLPNDDRARKNAYHQKAESTGNSDKIRTFHSSQCICDLGVRSSSLCDVLSCGICKAVKSSFKVFAFGVPRNSGRFGEGIYSCRDAAKADRFATSCTSSPYRVMVACNVVTAPPSKTWWFATQVHSTEDDERVFVNNSDAITPRYVILYGVQ